MIITTHHHSINIPYYFQTFFLPYTLKLHFKRQRVHSKCVRTLAMTATKKKSEKHKISHGIKKKIQPIPTKFVTNDAPIGLLYDILCYKINNINKSILMSK